MPQASFLERMRRQLVKVGEQAKRRWWLERPFSGASATRLLLLTEEGRIARSQSHPFHHYTGELRRRRSVEVREVGLLAYLRQRRSYPRDADVVFFQEHFHATRERLDAVIDQIKQSNPQARLVFLDWFAPTDLRLMDALEPHIHAYVKKHIFRDRSQYDLPTYGDTNLVEFYSRRYGLPERMVHYKVSPTALAKLVVGPSFLTADYMLRHFLRPLPPYRERHIDVHARMAVRGSPWYERMRLECLHAVASIPGIKVAKGERQEHELYLRELRTSKICFSPFGYGEVCWRDFEAIMCGAVLLKPDMSHVETRPDIFMPDETYVPVRWDLSDLEARIRELLADPERQRRIASRASGVLRDYLQGSGFVDLVSSLIE